MLQDINIRVKPETASDRQLLFDALLRDGGIRKGDVNDFRVVRRSIDARRKPVVVNLTVRVATGDDAKVHGNYTPVSFSRVPDNAPQVVVVGAGPAGLFAGLQALRHGLRPVLLERGKDVDSRRLDITALNRERAVDPESNYCFGEGGAGAFSDGKLYTRSRKRGNVDSVLSLLHQHGASEDVLIDAHAHIGSDRLPSVIKNIRQTIADCGGEVHFSTKVTSLIIEDGEVRGVVTADGNRFDGPVVLATGHSARDVYRFLHVQNVALEAKGFAMGVRLEHPQHLIDCLQYHSPSGRGKYLPAAEYSFSTQVDGRGVYSFCMCPGGVIVPAASAPGELVVNGMSASARAGHWSNSGMVVEIRPEDFPEYSEEGVFSLLKLQEDLERRFFEDGAGPLNAPAQLMTDFVAGRDSKVTLPSSYIPGLHPARFDRLLPPFIWQRLKEGFRKFDRMCPGFLSSKAQLVGLESRTSSPVRIPRDGATLQHTSVKGLYPAGEGAGYAGGIVSAAIDGMRCVDSIAVSLGVLTPEKN